LTKRADYIKLLKDFLKPNYKKIILFVVIQVILILFIFVFNATQPGGIFYPLIIRYSSNPFIFPLQLFVGSLLVTPIILIFVFYGLQDLIFNTSSNTIPIIVLISWIIISILTLFIWYIISCLILLGFEKIFVKIKKIHKNEIQD